MEIHIYKVLMSWEEMKSLIFQNDAPMVRHDNDMY